MTESRTALVTCVHAPGESIRLEVPASVFSSAAEQLRWDALRSGQLDADEWPVVQATAAPAYVSTAAAEDERDIIISLRNVRREVHRRFPPRDLQRLQLYLARSVPWRTETDVEIEYVWNGSGAVSVPIAPLSLPFEAFRRARIDHPPHLELAITDAAREQLATMCRESQADEVELGGCLLGRVTLDRLIVESVARAPADGGSAAGFSFDPRFWRQAERSRAKRQHILGWVHSHVCGSGHPRGISQRDLLTAYEHFSAPWFLTALVCAAREAPEVRWYGWANGGLVERGDNITLTA